VVRAGLFDGSLCFGGEEEKRRPPDFCGTTAPNGPTDKEGPIMALLAARSPRAPEKTGRRALKGEKAEFGTT